MSARVHVEFGLLGPLYANVRGEPVPLGSGKLRIVLATLLLQANQAVATSALVERLWDVEPARGTRNTAQSYVMRLRAALGDAGRIISTHPGGYLVEVADSALDLSRFRRHAHQAQRARESGDLRTESRELRAGLALWRGTPLSDVPSEHLQRHEAPSLVEEHLRTLQRRIDVDLELGRHAELVPELQALTSRHRLRERFWGQLMLALVGSERQSDALAAYRQVSALLRDELGVDPGEPLQSLHRQILSGEHPAAARPAAAPAASTTQWSTPRQLPADIADFTGRHAETRRIQRLVRSFDGNAGAVPIVLLSGPPGAGKTALAVHAAHALADDFPDGQLYLDLRGYSTSPPVPAADALTRVLRGMGTPPEQVPSEADDQSALFRSKLAHRRVLVVLDNAIQPEQVRPLLPGSASCAVIVTSRDNLPSLSALNGAQRVPVEPISREDARQLLVRLLSEHRVAAEPVAAERLAAFCGYLPLAIRITAANLLNSGAQGIAEYLDELEGSERLDTMSIEGDPQAAVHRAFDLSYGVLPAEVARVFRLTSLIAGPDFDRFPVAALADATASSAKRALDQLVQANLLQGTPSGRYQVHDLIREFARVKSEQSDTVHERRRALRRLFDFYVETAHAARTSQGENHESRAHRTSADFPGFSEPAEGRRWLKAETANIVALLSAASHLDDSLPLWRLAAEVFDHFQQQRLDTAWRDSFVAALSAAERQGDREGCGRMEFGLGRLDFHRARYDDANARFARAAALCRDTGDLGGEARALTGIGAVAFDRGDYAEAVSRYEDAVRLFRRAPDCGDQVATLYNLGVVLMMSGRNADAVDQLTLARRSAQRLRMPLMQARIVASSGVIALWSGRLRTADALLDEAASAMRDLAYPQYLAEVLRSIAELRLEEGNVEEAEDQGWEAAARAQKIGSPWLVVGIRTLLGHVALRRDDVDGALAHFTMAANEFASGVRHWRPSTAQGLSEAHRRAGRLDLAAEYVAEAARSPRPRDRGRAHLESAEILAVRGRPVEAIAEAEKAARTAHAHGYRLDEVRALQATARLRSLTGEDGRADELRRRAHDIIIATALSDQSSLAEGSRAS